MNRWSRVWRSVSSLTPLLLILLLAAFSWWVAREAMRGGAGPRRVEPAQQPDYFLQGFRTRSFDGQGRPTSQLSGASMQHIPGDQTVHIAQPQLRAVDAHGVVTEAGAREGISNADGSNVQLIGAATLSRQAPGAPALAVSSDFLNVFPNRQLVLSDRPSTMRRGDSVFSGDDLRIDGVNGVVELHGKVLGHIESPRS